MLGIQPLILYTVKKSDEIPNYVSMLQIKIRNIVSLICGINTRDFI
jgi:hypothetical protein